MKYYTPGKNVYGQKVKTVLVTLHNDSFRNQILEAFQTVADYQRKNKGIEFTFDHCQLSAENVKNAELTMRFAQTYIL